MKIKCLFGHQWPEVWTKYAERKLILADGLWFEVFEKVCERGCGARKTLEGPLRYSDAAGGGITGY